MFYTSNAPKRALAIWLTGLIACAFFAASLPSAAYAQDEPASKTALSGEIQIQFDTATGIHFVVDPEYPDDPMVLYCMNNKKLWPHKNDQGLTPPPYLEGYLTAGMFKSEAEYRECLRKLGKILYAGYPYNGERLYKIVEEGEVPTVSEDEYNEMLITPPQLIAAFPYLAHHEFKLSDYYNGKSEHLDVIKHFISDVGNLFANNGVTSNGLTHDDIIAMPFYHAAYCISYAMNSANTTPEQAYAEMYKSSYFVTHEQAYDATQFAIWSTLDEYGVEGNDYSAGNLNKDMLSHKLYVYSQRGELLSAQPDSSEVKLTGDLGFTYNPKDGMWHSGKIKVEEPAGYHGMYELSLPKGVTALCEHLTYVYAGEEYELVSDHAPAASEAFSIRAEIPWMREMKQYRPSATAPEGAKEFQSMVGAVVYRAQVGHVFNLHSNGEGGISIAKTVKGEAPSNQRYDFELCLPQKKINGLYGDLEFHDGVAKFQLAGGEILEASHLPSDTPYVVTELSTGNFTSQSTAATGTVIADEVLAVEFVNDYGGVPCG